MLRAKLAYISHNAAGRSPPPLIGCLPPSVTAGSLPSGPTVGVAEALPADWLASPGRALLAGREPGAARRHGHSNRPGGWIWLGSLQPRPLCLLHHLDHHTALHRQRPRHPSVLLAQGVCCYYPCSGWAPAAAIYRHFHSDCNVEEQETCKEIGLKAQLKELRRRHLPCNILAGERLCLQHQADTSPRALFCSC